MFHEVDGYDEEVASVYSAAAVNVHKWHVAGSSAESVEGVGNHDGGYVSDVDDAVVIDVSGKHYVDVAVD